jgi:hypothetical protein
MLLKRTNMAIIINVDTKTIPLDITFRDGEELKELHFDLPGKLSVAAMLKAEELQGDEDRTAFTVSEGIALFRVFVGNEIVDALINTGMDIETLMTIFQKYYAALELSKPTQPQDHKSPKQKATTKR